MNLQNIYSDKAAEDIDQVMQFAKEILERLEMPLDHIQRETVALMCKNARNLRLVRSRPSSIAEDPKQLLSHLRNQDTFRNAGYTLLLEAADTFRRTHARTPGDREGEEWTEDVVLLMKACQSITDLGSLEQELQSELQSMALEVCPASPATHHSRCVCCIDLSIQGRRITQHLSRHGRHCVPGGHQTSHTAVCPVQRNSALQCYGLHHDEVLIIL